MKRALVLGGGGPACGLQIGALRRLAEAGIIFDVWSLSCIGAWVGIVVNQFPESDPVDRVRRTYEWFTKVYQPDDVCAAHPANPAFAPDIRRNVTSLLELMLNPKTYRQLVVPREIMDFSRDTLDLLRNRNRWTEGDFNIWMLRLMGAHPATRFLTSAMYRTSQNGLARIYYPDSSFLKEIKFTRLLALDRPVIYHNAWSLTRGTMEYFSNRIDDHKIIDAQTLCACSALPYIFAPVEIEGEVYCEGAMMRPMDFEPLEWHSDLDEVWTIPVVDSTQLRAPKDMTGAMGNLPMMPAGAHGAHLTADYKRRHPNILVHEVEVSARISYEWSRSNLELGCREGYNAAEMAIAKYRRDKAA